MTSQGNAPTNKAVESRAANKMQFQFTFKNIYFSKILESKQCAAKDGCDAIVTVGLPLCGKHRRSEARLEIKESTIPGAGNGLFATDLIKAGSAIAEYSGERLTKKMLDRRYGTATAPYCIKLKHNVFIDAAAHRSAASLVNHGGQENANARFVALFQRRPQTIELRALRDITQGEEILVDYGKEYRFNEKNVTIKTF